MISHTLQRSSSIRWYAAWASCLIAKKMNFFTYLFSSLNPKPCVWTPSPLTVLNSLVKLSLYHVLCNDGRDSINLLHNGPAHLSFHPHPPLCTGCIQNADMSLFIITQLVIVRRLCCDAVCLKTALNWTEHYAGCPWEMYVNTNCRLWSIKNRPAKR